jgi:hypothetical protein
MRNFAEASFEPEMIEGMSTALEKRDCEVAGAHQLMHVNQLAGDQSEVNHVGCDNHVITVLESIDNPKGKPARQHGQLLERSSPVDPVGSASFTCGI